MYQHDAFLADESRQPTSKPPSDIVLTLHVAIPYRTNVQVAALAGVLDTDLTNRKATSEVDVGPLLTASYASLIETELKRRLKQAPVAFWARPPAKLFSDDATVDLPGWQLS